jgi:hypothetical protein
MAAGALVTYLVIGGVSFGVWQEWWLALGALAVIAAASLALKRATPIALRTNFSSPVKMRFRRMILPFPRGYKSRSL